MAINTKALSLFPKAVHKGIVAALLELADNSGVAKVGLQSLAKSLGVSRTMILRVIETLSANNLADSVSDAQGTTITFLSGSKRTAKQAQVKPKQGFIKPSVEEVRQYCTEKGYAIDAEKFVNYYDSVGWVRGKTKIVSWKATLATWNKNNKEYESKSFTNNPATRAEGRRHMSNLATAIISNSASQLADLYNGGDEIPDNRDY